MSDCLTLFLGVYFGDLVRAKVVFLVYFQMNGSIRSRVEKGNKTCNLETDEIHHPVEYFAKKSYLSDSLTKKKNP